MIPIGGGSSRTRPATEITLAQEQRLLRRARRGDDAAVATILERHDEVLRSLVAGMVGIAAMDELMLTGYVKAYRALPRLGDSSSVHAWLYRMMYSTCLDRLRREWRRANRKPIGIRPSTDSKTSKGSGRAEIADHVPVGPLLDRVGAGAGLGAALEKLPVDQRAVLLLIDRHGFGVNDVARILDVGTSVVSSLLEQARTGFAIALHPDGVTAEGGEEVEPGDPTDAAAEPAGGNEVAELPVPSHGRGFWNELGRRLLAERQSPALPTPTVMAMAARAPAAGSHRPEGSLPSTAPWPDIGRPSGGGGPGITPGSVAVALLGLVTVMGIVALALRIGADAEPPLERQGTVAQDVGDRVATRLAGLETFSAVIERAEVNGAGETRTAYKLVRAVDGSYELISLAGDRTVTYHAPSDIRRERLVSTGPAGPVVTAREETGFAGGPPDPSPADIALPDSDVGLALRSLRSSGRRLAKAVKVGGRALWVLDAELEEGASVGADAIVLTVDQAKLLPLSVRITADGQPVRTTVFSQVEPNAAVPPGSFTIAFAPGDAVAVIDHGFAPMPLRDVGTTVGFEALRPTFLPEDFVLDATRVRAEGAVVSLRYRRGSERVVVSTRRSPVPAGQPWPDPFPLRGERLPGSSVTLRTGALAGQRVEVATGSDGKLELWGSDGSFAVTVAGDLTRMEIQQVAESLR